MCDGISAAVCNAIVQGTYDAASEWNDIPFDPDGGNVEFCQRSEDPTRDVSRAATCPTTPVTSVRDDGFTVTIRLVDGEVPDSSNCTDPHALACVWPKNEGSDAGKKPIGDRIMYIKQPAYIHDETEEGSLLVPVIWSNDPDDHYEPGKTEDGEDGVYVYLRHIIMQEFAHTAGLADTDDLNKDEYDECLMSSSLNTLRYELFTSVPDCDAKYLNQNQRRNQTTKPKSHTGVVAL